MGIEASLDRIQACLHKGLNDDNLAYILKAYSSTKKTLGFVRKNMKYHERREQQTLIAFGFGRFNSHRKRLE